MIEMFSLPFMQRALIAGSLIGLVASYYGAFVVQRRMSFLGNGLAHAAFGGVALGLLLDVEPVAVAAIFTVAIALGIPWIQGRTGLASDTAIGIFFSVAMALGIVFLSMRENYTADAFGYLFGDILLITKSDVWAAAAVAGLTLLTTPLWGRWAYATFDRDLAQADRLPVTRDDYLLSVALAVSIVVALKVVGIVLVASFLVIPAAAARLVAPTFAAMTVISMVIGVAGVVLGLMVSWEWNMPSGAAIILVHSAMLFLMLPLRRR